ncbi:MAG TPA: type II toxin-antitoxin system HicB family antitoxin [Bryobacteraceae bacterium]|jgi:predicted RNase H-like HicB family nuclease/predicted RNA binding protein YcfA (HicA-like mRNA interferase family)
MKICDIIKQIEADGWRFHSQKGSHRQYTHASKPGRVTVAGMPGDDVPEDAREHSEASSDRKDTEVNMQYAIVIEKAPGSNYSAYAPDLPGCIATADTLEDVKRLMQEGIAFHLEGMREDGLPIPEPSTQVATVEVAA